MSGRISIAAIQQAVATYYGLTRAQILGPQRARSLARPRQMAMFLAHRMTGKSSGELGLAFRRDHATVLHGVRETERRLVGDADLRAAHDAIVALLTQAPPALAEIDAAKASLAARTRAALSDAAALDDDALIARLLGWRP